MLIDSSFHGNWAQLEDILRSLLDGQTALKTALDTEKTLTDELYDDATTNGAALDNLITAHKNYGSSDGAIAIATTVQKVKSTATINYCIAGVWYTKGATDNLWVLTGFDCAISMYNKCLLCLDTAGAMQIVVGTEAAAAADVVLGAIPAAWAVVGMVQVLQSAGGAFTGATTGLDDATTTDTYFDYSFVPATIGDTAGATAAAKATAVGTLPTTQS